MSTQRESSIQIPSPLIEFILLGPMDDRRQIQDSPILGDVWVEFGRRPDARIDLLITPYRGQHAGEVAHAIDEGLKPDPESPKDEVNIAFLQGFIAACLTFPELMRVVAPKTKWWISRRIKDEHPQKAQAGGGEHPGAGAQTNKDAVHEIMQYEGEVRSILEQILKSAEVWHSKTGELGSQELPSIKRFIALTALILWAGTYKPKKKAPKTPSADAQITYVLQQAQTQESLSLMAELLKALEQEMLKDETEKWLVWQVSRNRKAMQAISKSIPAVKADAATTLFKVDCNEISWAVIDSGIDGDHPAFLGKDGKSRVKRSFDFKHYRKIMTLSNSREAVRTSNINEIVKDNDRLLRPIQKPDDSEGNEKRLREAHEDLRRLAEDARRRGPIHWDLVEKYVEIKPGAPTLTNHGTHVAGIIGANKQRAQKHAEKEAARRARENTDGDEDAKLAAEGRAVNRLRATPNLDFADGMCPDITLYDFRVLGPKMEDAEFSIIAALQFIRYMNNQDIFLAIHGANLSLSIPHDVRNFACGRTPICDECEQLVSSGVVVVAAAGNHGYKSFETKEGSYDGYAAFSITDPGNADRVITVGATHRFWPHTYGVSFFSSRGPTGDGRTKPDLVAPGERIRAPVPENHEAGGNWGDLDGTSMAAPHVSGAAAMLMARYQELIGQPDRIKRILCESATDLGRERSFQGHGMLDVLRAFQSI